MGFAAARIKGYYDPWKSAIDALCTDEEQCILTNKDANYYWWMSAMFGMADSAFQNVAVAVLASYLVLVLVTKNFLVPILAVISIGSTITWVLAGIFLMGYEFEFFAAESEVFDATGRFPPSVAGAVDPVAEPVRLTAGPVSLLF